MNGLHLALRQSAPARIDAAPLALHPRMNARELANFIFRSEHGQQIPLGDLFIITPRDDGAVHIEGDLSLFDGLGTGMKEGSLVIDGHVGHRTGQDLAGGQITIRGSAGDDLGSHMSGGTILVHGDAGHRAGSARPGAKKGMTGGDMIILGNAGDETGAFLRRGTIAVAGHVGNDTLHAALAGTVLTMGDVGDSPGRLNKRATLITFGKIAIPSTYRRACAYHPTFVRVLLRYLQRSHNFPATTRHLAQLLDRHCGDFAESGRGEILCPSRH